MAIPSYDHNFHLPPHLGDPTKFVQVSPYPCTTLEFCMHFATSKERIEILKNFLTFRQRMKVEGIVTGFQWLNGSFTSDIETIESRPPNDLDLVTFFDGRGIDSSVIVSNFNEFVSFRASKAVYKLDHYPVNFTYDPYVTVGQTTYWIQLFSHSKPHQIWKGILEVKIDTPNDDNLASDYLNSLIP